MNLRLVYERKHSTVNQVYYCVSDDTNVGLILSELLKQIKGVSLCFSIYGVNGDHHKFLLFILRLKKKKSLHSLFSTLPSFPSNSLF